jgi:hypothetical protein
MAIPSKNADLYRRIRLYVFGLLLGIVVVKFAYKGKACQMPGSAKLEELREQKREQSEKFNCEMQQFSISDADVDKVMHNGKVNFEKSEVRQKPCGHYFVEGETKTGSPITFQIDDCDTISRFVSILFEGQKSNCN